MPITSVPQGISVSPSIVSHIGLCTVPHAVAPRGLDGVVMRPLNAIIGHHHLCASQLSAALPRLRDMMAPHI